MKTATTLVTVLCLVASTAAMSQDRNDDHGGRNDGPGRSGQGYQQHGGPNGASRMDQQGRQNDRGNSRYRDDHQAHGAGPGHDLYRGKRIPSEYRSRQYVVDDYRHHNLKAPPRGYHWVQTGADYALVAVATGLIAQVILGN